MEKQLRVLTVKLELMREENSVIMKACRAIENGKLPKDYTREEFGKFLDSLEFDEKEEYKAYLSESGELMDAIEELEKEIDAESENVMEQIIGVRTGKERLIRRIKKNEDFKNKQEVRDKVKKLLDEVSMLYRIEYNLIDIRPENWVRIVFDEQ